MNRFVLPVTIAAAVHAALLFGFPTPPRPPVDTKKRPALECHDPIPTILIAPEKPSEPEHSEQPAGGGAPVPDLPDVVAPTSDNDFTTLAKPSVDTSDRKGVSTIPFGWNGAPGDGPLFDGPPSLPSFKDLDASPRARAQIAPDYPPSAKVSGTTGEVTVGFIVDEAGRVLEPRAISSTDRIFEEPAVRAVGKWRFVPGTIQGRPVRFRMSVPIVFKLNDD